MLLPNMYVRSQWVVSHLVASLSLYDMNEIICHRWTTFSFHTLSVLRVRRPPSSLLLHVDGLNNKVIAEHPEELLNLLFDFALCYVAADTGVEARGQSSQVYSYV